MWSTNTIAGHAKWGVTKKKVNDSSDLQSKR